MSSTKSSERKIVTWRVSQHPSSDKLNKWCDQQTNLQDSISNIVEHMIEIFGYRNITDYDIQKVLYQGLEAPASYPVKKPSNDTEPIENTHTSNEPNNSVEVQAPVIEPKQVPEPTNEQIREDKNSDDDDFYNEVNVENL